MATKREPKFVLDYLASLRAHQADGTLDDVRLAELLEVIGSRQLRAMGRDVGLTADEHAEAKRIAIKAIEARGGLFQVVRRTWFSREGRLRSEIS